MANRTVQILGYGYGSNPCNANVSYNGATVFSGTIPTLNQQEIIVSPDGQVVLFTFEIDIAAAGTFPFNINFSGGNLVYVEQVLANYSVQGNVSSGPNEYTVISSPQSKSNVFINGISAPSGQPPGEWGYEVPIVSGVGTLVCNLIVSAGMHV